MRAISLICPKLNSLITWSQNRGINLCFHCPKHICSQHLTQQVQHSSHLLLWNDPYIAESNFIEGMTSRWTWGGDGLLSWFCTSAGLGIARAWGGKAVQNNGAEMVVLEGNGEKIVASEKQSISLSLFWQWIIQLILPWAAGELQFSPLWLCE